MESIRRISFSSEDEDGSVELFLESPSVFVRQSNPFESFSRELSETLISTEKPCEKDLDAENSQKENEYIELPSHPPAHQFLPMMKTNSEEETVLSPIKPDKDDVAIKIQKAIHHRELKELEVLLASPEGKAFVNVRSMDGQTALHFACWGGHDQAVRLLIKAGAYLESRDQQDGSTPLQKACFNGHLQIAQDLLQAGADLTTESNDGKTALHMACWEGQPEVVRFLADQGANVHSMDDGECTPLHYACMGGHLEVVEYILFKGAQARAADNDKWTPLHYACYFGMIEVVSCLLEHGASIHDQTRDGQRPGWSFYDTVPEQTRLSIARSLGAYSVSRSVEEQECTVCMDGPKESLMAPCGHVSCCHSCAMAIYNQRGDCPVCRQQIRKVYKVYYT